MSLKKVIHSFESIGVIKNKSEDQAIAIKTFNWILFCAFLAGSIWTYLLYFIGQTNAVVFPLLAIISMPLILLFSHLTKKFVLALNAFLIMMLSLPALVQIFHGGFVNSGAVIAWSVIVPMMALSFRPPIVAIRCFVLFILIVIVTVLIEIYIPIDHKAMSRTIIISQFTLNLIGIIIICFVPLLNFSKEFMVTRKLLKTNNKEIIDSINYAKRIQAATLLSKEKFIELLKGSSFLFFKPKDIIGGDFYWAYQCNDDLFIACSDCTGHGVPGAFMTMIGINHLNYIVRENKESDPSVILSKLQEKVTSSLNNSSERVHDGMDITICKINYKKQTIEYASAMSKVYFFNGEQLERCANDKCSIGDSRRESSFTKYTLNFKKGDVLYLTTDGYIDQFGGTNNKKFGSKRFKELLATIVHLDSSKQNQLINSTFYQWKGDKAQIDDITLIGIKF